MNCSPTITAEEFRTIHNALWELDSVTQQLEDILKPELFTQLARAGAAIRKGLDSAYAQDNQAYETKSNHYDSVKKDLGLRSEWSIFDIDNLNERHPFEGVRTVVYADNWGGVNASCQVNGLTWAALWVAADAAIRNSGDEHHMFIEGFRQSKDYPEVLFLSTGS